MATSDVCDLLCLDLERGEALRRDLPENPVLERLSEAAKGFGDPTRLGLALALRDGGELCVCDLAWVSGRSDKLVSHHLRLLRGAGLARSRKDGRMMLYTLTSRGQTLLEALLVAEAVSR